MTEWQKKRAKEYVEKAFDQSDKTSTMSAKEVEQAVLGALMIEKTAIIEVSEVLTSNEFFYLEAHKIIYGAILEMEQKNEPVDLMTVNQSIISKGLSELVGGISYLIELTNMVNSSANIVFHSMIVVEYWIKRKASLVAIIANQKANDFKEDCFDLLDEMEAGISEIKNRVFTNKSVNLSTSISNSITFFSSIKDNGGLIGVPTGIIELDRRTGGAAGGDLILVGGRPGSGKSIVKLIFAHNASVNFKIPVAIFDYEDRPKQNDSRLMALNTGIDYGDIYMGKPNIDFNFVAQKMAGVDYSKFHIEYANYALNILCSKIKQYVRKHKVGAIFINQLSFIKVNQSFQREDQMLGFISGTLKQLAVDLNVPIYLFLQLKKEIDDRPDVRPHKGDIKLSGKLEEDADTIILMTRPANYSWFREGVKPYYYRDQIFDIENKTLFDYCKTRNGEPFEEWLNLEAGKLWLYGSDNPFRIVEKNYTFNDHGEVFQLPEKNDVFKSINGAIHFERNENMQ